jgi:hypothetical protein
MFWKYVKTHEVDAPSFRSRNKSRLKSGGQKLASLDVDFSFLKNTNTAMIYFGCFEEAHVSRSWQPGSFRRRNLKYLEQSTKSPRHSLEKLGIGTTLPWKGLAEKLGGARQP